MTEHADTQTWARTPCTAFSGPYCIASGELRDVALHAKRILDADRWAAVLIFDDTSGRTVEVDFRGTPDEVRQKLDRMTGPSAAAPAAHPVEAPATAGPGRPKLGVIAREVTLLPRHWEWLATQPGGASVALRKLVEAARRDESGRERIRLAQEASYRFMHAMSGELTGLEEVSRALFAGDRERFELLTDPWPTDLRAYARKLAEAAFPPPADPGAAA